MQTNRWTAECHIRTTKSICMISEADYIDNGGCVSNKVADVLSSYPFDVR